MSSFPCAVSVVHQCLPPSPPLIDYGRAGGGPGVDVASSGGGAEHSAGGAAGRTAPGRRIPHPAPIGCWVVVMIAFASVILGPAAAVHITALRVPAVVRNGSRAGAVLDCEYALGAREQRRLASETGLVVKWFLVGSGPAPVYQWIPGQRPQDFGALRGRVDLAFKVTGSDERGAHRALRIPTPTTDLSGEYKCSVSTFEDEDFMVKKMLVFAPEQSLEISQSKSGPEDAVNVSCSARGVYPEPKLALYWSHVKHLSSRRDGSTASALEGVETRATLRGDAYDVVASKLLLDLPSTPTVFDCHLVIAEADYAVRKSIVYYPNGSGPDLSSGCRSVVTPLGPSGLAVVAAVLCIPLGALFTPLRAPRHLERACSASADPLSPCSDLKACDLTHVSVWCCGACSFICRVRGSGNDFQVTKESIQPLLCECS